MREDTNQNQDGVTEILITEVLESQKESFLQWNAKVCHMEAAFPGFRGAYLQPPAEGKGKLWITFLKFDTEAHLNQWLRSSERRELLEEFFPMVSFFESHQLISPYARWFSSVVQTEVEPAVWKQTMIVLLVLFPVVMLENKYLSPLTAGLSPSLAIFIGNAISVSLISFPLMPLAIRLLYWWLIPPRHRYRLFSMIGTFIVLTLYMLEIVYL